MSTTETIDNITTSINRIKSAKTTLNQKLYAMGLITVVDDTNSLLGMTTLLKENVPVYDYSGLSDASHTKDEGSWTINQGYYKNAFNLSSPDANGEAADWVRVKSTSCFLDDTTADEQIYPDENGLIHITLGMDQTHNIEIRNLGDDFDAVRMTNAICSSCYDEENPDYNYEMHGSEIGTIYGDDGETTFELSTPDGCEVTFTFETLARAGVSDLQNQIATLTNEKQALQTEVDELNAEMENIASQLRQI